jgi:hypothetical protein
VDKIKSNSDLPLYGDITKHPQKRLKSRYQILDLEFPVKALLKTWKTSWRDSGVQGVTFIESQESLVMISHG